MATRTYEFWVWHKFTSTPHSKDLEMMLLSDISSGDFAIRMAEAILTDKRYFGVFIVRVVGKSVLAKLVRGDYGEIHIIDYRRRTGKKKTCEKYLRIGYNPVRRK